MLCDITCHVMLYNPCHVMLYNICNVMLCLLYNMCHVMLYNMSCYVMRCYITHVMFVI